MPLDYSITEITDSNIDSLNELAQDAIADGHTSVQRTIDEWKDGSNKFSKDGEKIWGIFLSDQCIGIGGINQDPFIDDRTVGRVRHLYISTQYRRLGLSKVLLKLILTHAKKYFTSLRLSTKNPIAASFYESFGFKKTDGIKVTHLLAKI